MNKIILHVSNLGYELVLLPEVIDFIQKKGFDQEYGARPLKRVIEKFIKNPISEYIISEKLKKGDKISLKMDASNDNVEVLIHQKK